MKDIRTEIEDWIYAGGGGLEVNRGDEKALLVSFYGLVDVIEDFTTKKLEEANKKANLLVCKQYSEGYEDGKEEKLCHICKKPKYGVGSEVCSSGTHLRVDVEKLASHCHMQWSGWMKYLFNKCSLPKYGTITIPEWAVARWTRQMNTEYKDLPEEEKESDREEARRLATSDIYTEEV